MCVVVVRHYSNRDNRNPTFWCSIGVLYYQINQYRDALDAYSRAIRLNNLSEVWYDLGTLYESCNQISDSLDAYQRAAELDPANKHIQQRLNTLRAQLTGNGDATYVLHLIYAEFADCALTSSASVQEG
jgi:cytochrome c-type biogenesis protein CcmH/NrfG